MKEQTVTNPETARKSREFIEIYQQCLPIIYRFLFLRTGDEPTAQDLTSTTILRAFKSYISHDVHPAEYPESPYLPWMMTIARHVLINYHRDSKRYGRLHQPRSLEEFLEFVPEAASDQREGDLRPIFESPVLPEEQVLNQEEIRQLYQAVSRLPPQHQEIIALKYAAKMPDNLIGQILGLTTSAVKSAHHRALVKLRQIYQDTSA